MPAIFQEIDKIRPTYDTAYRAVLFLCRLLLVVDTLITTMAVAGRYIPLISDPAWSEEVILTYMSYMAVLSTALTIRGGAYIRMTAFDRYLPPKLIRSLDIVADLAVLVLAAIIIMVGWRHAAGIGAKGIYVSMPEVSRFWMYFSMPLAGVVMLVFEVEALYNHVKSFFVKEGMEQWIQITW